jgi:hypothetical protein
VRPGLYPLDLYRGDAGAWLFRLWDDDRKTVPTSLVGATAAAQVRSGPGGALLLTMTCTITLPNIVNMVLAAGDWATWTAGTLASWDLQVTFPGGPVTVLAGPVAIGVDVTV